MSEWSDSAKAALADAARSKTVGGIPIPTALTILGLMLTITVSGFGWANAMSREVAALQESKSSVPRMTEQIGELQSQQTALLVQVAQLRTLLDERLPRK
jgi:hypothetical protein